MCEDQAPRFSISALMSQVSQRITDNKNGDKLVDE